MTKTLKYLQMSNSMSRSALLSSFLYFCCRSYVPYLFLRIIVVHFFLLDVKQLTQTLPKSNGVVGDKTFQTIISVLLLTSLRTINYFRNSTGVKIGRTTVSRLFSSFWNFQWLLFFESCRIVLHNLFRQIGLNRNPSWFVI